MHPHGSQMGRVDVIIAAWRAIADQGIFVGHVGVTSEDIVSVYILRDIQRVVNLSLDQ